MKKILNVVLLISLIASLFMVLPITANAATTVAILDGKVTITDSVGNGSGDASAYTITASGSLISKTTNNITITNASGEDGVLSFNYSATSANACTVAGTASTSGSYSNTISAGGTVAIVLTSNSGLGNTTATLKLTNITFAGMSASSDMTYVFDGNLGTVTAGGTAISSGDVVTVDAVGTQMVATPKSGVTFFGWVNEDGAILSTSTTYTQQATGETTITAVFSDGTVPYFKVDNKYIFSDLNSAGSAGTNILLLCNGTLPAGNYTIPSGATLNIPMDASNTLYTNVPPSEEASTYIAPTLYRKLTLAKDAKITVNGAISIGGKLSASQGSHGSLIGTYGQIDMASESAITVNNGGKLYAWGYITGSGSVTAKSGATVYEPFQVRDWRGGDATTSMLNNSQRVFPMSQYYVQNIQVPLTLESGATENGFMAVYVSYAGIQKSEVPFIGTSGMFNIVSGNVIKDYDENTDRLVIDVNGTLDMQPLELSMKITALGGAQKLNTENYTLPINGNITLNINGGSTVNVLLDFALLPGSEIYVDKGGKCIFGSGSSVYIYDADEWGAYCAHTNTTFLAANHAIGRKKTRTDADIKDAVVYVEGEVDASAAEVYTTASGANICGGENGIVKIAQGAREITYQVTQSGTDISVWNEIPVTTAWLKNADESYVDPETLGDCGKEFTYKNGVWEPKHTNIVTVPGTAATCTEEGLTEGKTCNTCGTVIQAQTSIPATGHTYGAWQKVDETNHSKACACGDVVTEAHTWDAGVVTTAATHTAEGVKTYTCTVCSGTKTETIAKTPDHEWGAWQMVDETSHSKTCGCGDVVTETHTWDAGVVTTAATHTAEGVKTYTCTVCNGTKTESVAKTPDHEWGEGVVTTPATHTTEGVMTYTCTCNEQKTETIAKTPDHEWGEGVVTTPATHTAEGVMTYTCTCNEQKTETIAKTPDHEWGEGVVTTPATHTAEGVMTYTCACNEQKTETIAKTPDHEWGEGVVTTPATHTEKGVMTYTCSCGDTKTESIAKTSDHEYGDWVKVDGKRHSRECICGSVETEAHKFTGFACTRCGCDKMVTSTSYVIENGTIKLNTELILNVSAGTRIIVALYNADGKLINAKLSATPDLAEVAFASEGVTKVKVFTWSGLNLLTPMSLVEEIDIK